MTQEDGTSARARAADTNAEFRAVRIADGIVTRPASAQTATVHAFLEHLRAQGLEDVVPEPLSNDGTTETLRLLEGDAGGDAWHHQHNVEGLESAARLLRRIHDASRTWVPPADAAFGHPVLTAPPQPGQAFCHGDPGPWNFVWRDGQARGVFDWDYLHPGDPVDDIAYALFWFAPTRADEHCLGWHHFPAVRIVANASGASWRRTARHRRSTWSTPSSGVVRQRSTSYCPWPHKASSPNAAGLPTG